MVLSHKQYITMYPCMYLSFASGVHNEGWFDPWTFLLAFQKKVLSMGVHYLDGEVVGVTTGNNNVVSAVQVGE